MPKKSSPSSPSLSLLTIIRELPDPRIERTWLHRFEDILIIALCALLCGAESFEDMEMFGLAKRAWLASFLELPHGIARHDTFSRLFAALDSQKFLEAFMRWTQSLRVTLSQEVVAIDGKALRRAIDAGQSPKVIVNAWAAGNGLVLGQRKVDEKRNEITAVPELIRTFVMARFIVTVDTLGGPKQITRALFNY